MIELPCLYFDSYKFHVCESKLHSLLLMLVCDFRMCAPQLAVAVGYLDLDPIGVGCIPLFVCFIELARCHIIHEEVQSGYHALLELTRAHFSIYSGTEK